jgi:membrane protease subunit (stomatin/prohibitin family)
MAKYETVKCEMLPQLMLWKYPRTTFKKPVELTVDAGYAAVANIDGRFFRMQSGKQILQLPDKKSDLSAEIYFVRTESPYQFRWGTKPQIEINEPSANVPIRLMGYGTTTVAIRDPLLLVQSAKNGLFPEKGDPLPDFFRELCMQALKSGIANFFGVNPDSPLSAPQHIQEILALMNVYLNPLLKPLGLNATGNTIDSLEVVSDSNSAYLLNKLRETAPRTEQPAANYNQPAQPIQPETPRPDPMNCLLMMDPSEPEDARSDDTAAAKRCPHCGQELYADDRFCPACGKPVSAPNQ